MRLQLIGAGALAAVLVSGSALADDGPDDGPSDGPNGWRISSDSLFYSDSDNVVVVSPQVSVHRALDDDGGSADARAVVDVVSAASVDVVSAATTRFSEVRTEVELDLAKAMGPYLPSLAIHTSHEPDYTSNGFGIGLRRNLRSSDTTLAVGYDLSLDRVGYTGTMTTAFSESLTSHRSMVSLTQVMDPNTVVRAIWTLSVLDGYMEKPYRFVPLFDAAGLAAAENDGVVVGLDTFDRYRLDVRPPEEVPDRRVGNSLAVRGVHYLDSLPGSLRVDYQLYIDSWGILANTLEPHLSWRAADNLIVAGYVRLYLQQAASFWQRIYVVDRPDQVPRWRSLDRDLSDFSAATGGARGEWRREPLSGYVDISAMETFYSDYLYLSRRLAMVVQLGFRVDL